MDHDMHKEQDFPISAGLLLGLGLRDRTAQNEASAYKGKN
jgi:hypothetical protein